MFCIDDPFAGLWSFCKGLGCKNWQKETFTHLNVLRAKTGGNCIGKISLLCEGGGGITMAWIWIMSNNVWLGFKCSKSFISVKLMHSFLLCPFLLLLLYSSMLASFGCEKKKNLFLFEFTLFYFLFSFGDSTQGSRMILVCVIFKYGF